MTVEEVKAKLPLAEVYELQPEFTYIILTKRDTVPNSVLHSLGGALTANKIRGLMLRLDDVDDAIRILEVKSE